MPCLQDLSTQGCSGRQTENSGVSAGAAGQAEPESQSRRHSKTPQRHAQKKSAPQQSSLSALQQIAPGKSWLYCVKRLFRFDPERQEQ